MDKNGDDIVMKSEIAQSIKHFLTDGEDYKLFGNCENFSVLKSQYPLPFVLIILRTACVKISKLIVKDYQLIQKYK